MHFLNMHENVFTQVYRVYFMFLITALKMYFGFPATFIGNN